LRLPSRQGRQVRAPLPGLDGGVARQRCSQNAGDKVALNSEIEEIDPSRATFPNKGVLRPGEIADPFEICDA